MQRLDWIIDETQSARSTIEFLLDDVSATNDIEDEDLRADLISSLEDAYEALGDALNAALRAG